MSRLALITGLMAAAATAQSSFAASGFTYIGCVVASPSSFPVNPDFTSSFTPEQCQQSCSGKASYVAIGNGCYCDASPSAQPSYTIVAGSQCNVTCGTGGGFCGGSTTSSGLQIYNLYAVSSATISADPDLATKTVTEPCSEASALGITAFQEPAILTSPTSTTTETITECPPEITNCPLRSSTQAAATTAPSCPSGCVPNPSAGLSATATTMSKPCPSGICAQTCPAGCMPASTTSAAPTLYEELESAGAVTTAAPTTITFATVPTPMTSSVAAANTTTLLTAGASTARTGAVGVACAAMLVAVCIM